jgi:hypothetical protein
MRQRYKGTEIGVGFSGHKQRIDQSRALLLVIHNAISPIYAGEIGVLELGCRCARHANKGHGAPICLLEG